MSVQFGGQLTARVERLEREVAKNARNSSRPPRAIRLAKQPARREQGHSPPKKGPQPGHEGKGRDWLASWAGDEVVEHWPRACGCGHVFCEGE